jgi:hypothetical protein
MKLLLKKIFFPYSLKLIILEIELFVSITCIVKVNLFEQLNVLSLLAVNVILYVPALS